MAFPERLCGDQDRLEVAHDIKYIGRHGDDFCSGHFVERSVRNYTPSARLDGEYVAIHQGIVSVESHFHLDIPEL